MGTAFSSAIQGVRIIPLKQIVDYRGAVLHMLRADAPHFNGFGEVYFSEVNPGVVKAWKRHLRTTQHLAVPVGRIKLVIYDNRADSLSKYKIEVIELGRPEAYYLVVIPPLLWYGFQGIATGASILANCTNSPHDPEETDNLEITNGVIPYDEW